MRYINRHYLSIYISSARRLLPQGHPDQCPLHTLFLHYFVHCDLSSLLSGRVSSRSYSCRDVKSVNLDKFRDDFTQSKLLQCFDDTYVELMNSELRLLM